MFIIKGFTIYKIIEPQPEIPITSSFYRHSSMHQDGSNVSSAGTEIITAKNVFALLKHIHAESRSEAWPAW